MAPLPSKNPVDRNTIARVASSARWGNGSPELEAARAALAAQSLAEHIRKFVATAPPLTPEQYDHLATLLRPRIGGDVK